MSTDNKPAPAQLGNGHTMCSYIVEAVYPGKEPFRIGTFNAPRGKTEHETEAAALEAASGAVDRFFKDHFPEGTARPDIIRARLGHMTFIPDDYQWRRT